MENNKPFVMRVGDDIIYVVLWCLGLRNV